MVYGLEQIKKLERIYVESNNEVREYILSKVMEIESETSCGLLIYQIH